MWPFKRKTQRIKGLEMKEILSRCEDLADMIVRRDMCVLKMFSSTQEELASEDFILRTVRPRPLGRGYKIISVSEAKRLL